MMKKALLINDSKFESLVLSDMLNQLDYEVEMVDEFDALYEIEEFSPDIVIVNFIMQETRGDSLISQIKNGKPMIKCLLSSSNIISLGDFDENKIDGILRTPVSMFTLRDTLLRIGELEKMEEIIYQSPESTNDKSLILCSVCDRDISAFGTEIVFCPFCGEVLD